MYIKSVRLRNFRNYEKAEVLLNPHMNLITGENAQGKTNFLESIVYLSLTRSHRIANDRRVIREGCEFADAQCVYEDGMEKEIEAVIYTKGKTLMVHHQPVKRSSEFVGQLNAVLFAPDDLRIFNDAPKDRRRVMNQEITKVSPKYLITLNHCQALLKERNLLLKSPHPDATLLDTLDEQMSNDEAVITEMRRQFIQSVDANVTALYRKLSLDQETRITVHYKCACEAEENLAEEILKQHREHREKDLENKVTTYGIHREDMIFEMNDRNLIQSASQGQKRMTMLAFKMSLLKYIEERTGKKPVLLLDDVLSELDETRQKNLLQMVTGPYQCILTATAVPVYLKNEHMAEFNVVNGTIQRIEGGAQ
jgi:DNA replication and repair protein RecF